MPGDVRVLGQGARFSGHNFLIRARILTYYIPLEASRRDLSNACLQASFRSVVRKLWAYLYRSFVGRHFRDFAALPLITSRVYTWQIVDR